MKKRNVHVVGNRYHPEFTMVVMQQGCLTLSC